MASNVPITGNAHSLSLGPKTPIGPKMPEHGISMRQPTNTISTAIVALALLLASGTCAMADVEWTLTSTAGPGVLFTDGDIATGYFLTNYANTEILGFDITVAGPATSADFIANVSVGYSLPAGTITFAYDPGFSPYLALFPASALPEGGGADPLTGTDIWHDGPGGDACPGCGVVKPGLGAELLGVNLPEPSTITILCIFAGIGAFLYIFSAVAPRLHPAPTPQF